MPQGSLRAGRQGQLYYSNSSALKPWRDKIATAIRAALPTDHVPVDVPVLVRVTFYMPRPKSVKREYPTAAPDLDKLMRAVGDALTASSIYTDDARVVEWRARKLYADEVEPGVEVEVALIA